MIERKILYYPTILVPSSWLKWAVLYWDKVSSIVPESWEDNPVLGNRQDRDCYNAMNYLWREEGLFEPTRPGFSHEKGFENIRVTMRAHEKLIDELEMFLKDPKFMSSINKDWKRYPMHRIHQDKLSRRALDVLRKLGLVERDKQDSNWFFAEEKVSLLYMALLAKNLADLDIDYTVSSTNRPEYEAMVFEPNDEKNGFASLRTKLLDVLPAPKDNVSLKKIVKFRKEKRTELLDFREVLDAFQREISCAKSQAEVKQMLLQYKERIEKETAKLKSSMKHSKIKTVFSMLSSLIDIKSPTLLETIGFPLANVPLLISGPIIAGTATIQIGCAWIDKRNEQTAKNRESPFSYLYHAERKKIIS